MQSGKCERHAFGRAELLLAVALVSILLQLFPGLLSILSWLIDVRHWPPFAWFALNLLALLILVWFRFGPELFNVWRERRKRGAEERALAKRKRDLQEQREMLERLQRGRARRIY